MKSFKLWWISFEVCGYNMEVIKVVPRAVLLIWIRIDPHPFGEPGSGSASNSKAADRGGSQFGAMEANPGSMEAHFGATEGHKGAEES